MDHIYYISANGQASEYLLSTKFIINHIWQKYSYGDNIAKALESGTDTDLSTKKPTLGTVPATVSDANKAAKAKENKMLYQAEIKKYVD